MHQTISWEIIQSVLDIFNKSSDQLRGIVYDNFVNSTLFETFVQNRKQENKKWNILRIYENRKVTSRKKQLKS
jgi:hypothetical protein